MSWSREAMFLLSFWPMGMETSCPHVSGAGKPVKLTLRKCKQTPEMIKYFTFDIWDTKSLLKCALLAPWVHEDQLLRQASTDFFPPKPFYLCEETGDSLIRFACLSIV